MKKLLLFLIALIAALPSFAQTNFPISSGASTSSIQSTISTAAGTSGNNTVTFASGGTWTITSTISVPCPLGTLVIQGPSSVFPYFTNNTASLTGAVSGGWGFQTLACQHNVSFQYLNWNGGQPSAGGGAFLYIPTGNSNITVKYNYLHGNWANLTTGHNWDGQIYLDGSAANTPVDSNIDIEWNVFGDGSTDCNLIMNRLDYQPAGSQNAYAEGGAHCQGIGIDTSNSNVTIQYNVFQHLEEGVKFYAGGYPNQSTFITTANAQIQYNWFHNIHRFALEAQQVPQSLFNASYNVMDAPVDANYGTGAFSIPQCCGTVNNFSPHSLTRSTNNTQISNPTTGTSVEGTEWWSYDSCSNNFIQGSFGNGCWYGHGVENGSASNNICQLTTGGVCISAETNDLDYSGAKPGTAVGNTSSTTLSQLTSPMPTITPVATGTYSSPVTVTITVPTTFNGGVGPQGPFTAYYTTDGSTPTTNSTVCNIWPATTCSFSVAAGSTVSSLILWGTINMPRSWASPYGWKPSGIATQHYTSGAPPTFSSVAFYLQGGGSSVTVGNSVQGCAQITYTSPTTVTTVCGNGTDTVGTAVSTYTTSASSVVSVTSSGSYAGLSAGTSNLTVKAGTHVSPNFALTVNPVVPVLQSVASNCAPNTLTVGQTLPCTLTCTYTPTGPAQCPSATWTTSDPTVFTIGSSSGIITGVGTGTAYVNGSYGGQSTTLPGQLITVTSATPPAATLTSATVSCTPTSAVVGTQITCSATCNYSDGTQTNCTTVDGHGNDANFTSSATGIATIVSASGVATGVAPGTTTITASVGGFNPTTTLTVVAAPTANVLGNNQVDLLTATTYPNYADSIYVVSPAYKTVLSSCSINLQGTHTANKNWDCLVTLGTATTQATSSLVQCTYVTTGTIADVGWQTCGINVVIPPSTGLWLGRDTNEAGPATVGQWDCNNGSSNCNGTAPTLNNGTYPFRTISQIYGKYSGNGTAMLATNVPPAGGFQQGIYATFTQAPTLVAGYIYTPGYVNALSPGQSLQAYVAASYSDGTNWPVSAVADQYGDTVTSYSSSNTSILTISSTGLVTAVGTGTASITATISSSTTTSSYTFTLSSTPSPLPSLTPRVLVSR